MAEQIFFLKQHDTEPVFQTILTKKDPGGNDVPVDLTNATQVLFKMQSPYTPNMLVANGVCTVVGSATLGQVQYQWIPSDTSSNGNFRAEVEVTFSDGSILTFPNTEYIIIQILGDLG